MRLIDADQLLDFINFDEKVIAPEEHTAQDIVMMIQTAPTIAPPPNAPLTLERLREMDREPIWCRVGPGQWGIINKFVDKVVFFNGGTIPISHLEGRAYRHKPEEEQ